MRPPKTPFRDRELYRTLHQPTTMRPLYMPLLEQGPQLVSATASAPRLDSTIDLRYPEDTAHGPTGGTTNNSSESRAASLDQKLMYCIELFQSLPIAFHKPIKIHILNTCHRNELIVKKMEGIHPLRETANSQNALSSR